ncbi:HIRAN domain-containing protein [Jeotgalibacillus sp. ET6]|uniref:HIRAN domain-containing protein n=1 Tax=Jeotgalibacillus sp. ET6 TaxID=3037260 RepID=UPI00241862C2|nr:HIRAN domain-containing protein [Jeotgalibacillus sp. ET6]MDG5472461.1 HIRAN domain-containing protein [Jeotgalibacillus sp. ET6]
MIKQKSLLLIWKNKKNDSYYHIGTLSFDGSFYTFEYSIKSDSTRNLKAAIESGYSHHPAFPVLDKIYKSDHLFESFNRRIPDRSRIGYEDFMGEFNLSLNSDRMDILQATRGALANDPYTFEPPLRLYKDSLRASFFINGMRHQTSIHKSWMHAVSAGDLLKLELEPDNIVDPFAVKILTANNIHLGYVPGIYNKALHALLKRNVPLTLLVRKIRPAFSPQWWIEVQFEAQVNVSDTDLLEKANLHHLLHRESA